ncbi:MAG: phosphotriesterase-related protein [Spirochaetia bacterium]|jgi:phosphotriesterase-related protein
MPRVATILGDIRPEEMGITYCHEHLISAPPERISKHDPDLILNDVDAMVRELAVFKGLGGKTICDSSAIDYGRNISAIVKVAKASGINVIATAGFNKALYFDEWISKASLEKLQERIHTEITSGIEGTTHRAGMLKFGTSYGMMKPDEVKTARAVCRVQRETGAPLFTHTEFGTLGLQQIALLKEEKVDLERVCIGHQDRNPDLWNIRKIAGHGCFVGIDQISKVKYYTDQVRIDLIIALAEKGLQEHILIGGDLARRSYLTAYGGGPGFGYIAGPFMERLREEMAERSFAAGRIDRIVEDLLINNPRRYFTIQR